MLPLFNDAETFWSRTHTLQKMLPIIYCLHPDTELISWSFKEGINGETYCVFGEEEIRYAWGQFDQNKIWSIGHNMSQFDSMLIRWRLGIKPKMWGCTQAMARPHFAKLKPVSGHKPLALQNLAVALGVGVKDATVLHNTQGKHLCDFTPAELRAMEKYNCEDTDQCAGIFAKLAARTPRDEFRIIHLTTRMLVDPRFEADINLWRQALDRENRDFKVRLETLARLLSLPDAETMKKWLGSAPKFGQLLGILGTECPMKPSPKQVDENGDPVMIPALAKTDEGFLALLEDDNPLVAAAATVRLDVKSTMFASRLQRFIDVSEACDGMIPVALNYAGADTTLRWSGSMKMNQQNMTRVNKKKPKPTDALRKGFRAPPGKKIVVADSSGIELRVNHFLWQVPESMALYRGDPRADLYRAFAGDRWGILPAEVSDEQRQMGKVSHLGLGFQSAWRTFQKFAKTQYGLVIGDEEAQALVKAWRAKYKPIVQGWYRCQDMLAYMTEGEFERDEPIDPWGLCWPTTDGIKTPGAQILYPNLRQELRSNGKVEWVYAEGRHKAKIYGGKMNENIVQHLARQLLKDYMLQVDDTYWGRVKDYTPSLTVHDELVYVTDEDDAEPFLADLQRVMRSPVSWWPQLVTWSEGSIADCYGDAK